MNRAAPSQDSSPESFARLLNRLTHPPGSHSSTADPTREPIHDQLLDPLLNPLADEYAVSVSISRDGAAALSGNRKRTLAPVRINTNAGSRNGAEAGAISYEHALRLHSRPRAAEIPDLPPPPPLESRSAPHPSPAGRAQAEAKAISALRRAKGQASVSRPQPSATSSAAPSTPITTEKLPSRPSLAATQSSESPLIAAHAGSRRAARSRKQHGPTQAASMKLPQPELSQASSDQSHARKTGKASPSSSTGGNLSAKASPAPSAPSLSARKAGSENRRRKQPRPTLETPPQTPSSAANPSNSLELELASQPLALAQRQSIVSIRLSTIESEQLRQRAAESGISVSAYMRSCVLEAEHLRAQVKQALVELRASHPLSAAPRREAPRLETPPRLFSAFHEPAYDRDPGPADPGPATAIRTGVFGFLSGVFAIVLGRFQR